MYADIHMYMLAYCTIFRVAWIVLFICWAIFFFYFLFHFLHNVHLQDSHDSAGALQHTTLRNFYSSLQHWYMQTFWREWFSKIIIDKHLHYPVSSFIDGHTRDGKKVITSKKKFLLTSIYFWFKVHLHLYTTPLYFRLKCISEPLCNLYWLRFDSGHWDINPCVPS